MINKNNNNNNNNNNIYIYIYIYIFNSRFGAVRHHIPVFRNEDYYTPEGLSKRWKLYTTGGIKGFVEGK